MSEPLGMIEGMNFPLADLRGIAEALGDALGGALADDAQRSLSEGELINAVRAAEELGRWADSLRLMLAGEVGRRSEAELGEDRITKRYGCADAAELIERATLVSGSTARARLRTAKATTTRVTLTGQHRPAPLDHARNELVAGRLSVDALTTIADALRPIQGRCDASALEAAEQELVRAATGDDDTPPCTIHELRIMATTWALFLDPDGTLPDDDRAERARHLRLGRKRHGITPLRGGLTDDAAAQFQLLLDAYLNPRVSDHGPAFRDIANDNADDIDRDDEHVHDPRTADQKRHDAFAGILAAAASSADSPTLGGAAPTLVVTVSEDELGKADGVAFLDGPDGETAVPASFARHIGCHGTLHRVTFDDTGAIASLTVTDRVFNRRQRRAIAARDGGCIIPGCRVRAAWTEIHHVIEHSRGGPTDTHNGVMLCWHHHRTIETSGWEIRMVAGAPQVRPPSWIDPRRRWRPPNRVLHTEFQRAKSA